MAWVQIQGASRKPGASDADVLNRLRLGRTAARAEAEQKASASAAAPPAGASLFKPPQLVRKEQQEREQNKLLAPRKALFGLPAWIQQGAAVVYRSRSDKNARFQVNVKEVTEEHVEIVFKDGDTWKRIPHSAAKGSQGPLRQLLPQKEKTAKAGAAKRPSNGRSRSPRSSKQASQQPLEILDDSDGEAVQVLDD
mmetsp:Transcript_41607/g.119015  ORF Transcript_41607/g.119015 Transcript_41607/m.119015 type:complete len:195 (+) Transcript_41607:71-655(+)